MLKDYEKSQKQAYDFIMSSINKNKISHAYLINSNGVSYSMDFAIDLAKSFLSFDDSVDIFNYPDFRVIEPINNVIKKEQVLELQDAFSLKPVYGKYLIYIIKDVNLFNKAAANTLLKFLEEPNPNIIAILIADNVYSVLETIVSRCQIISLIPCDNDLVLFIKNELKDLNLEFTLNDFVSFYVNLEKDKFNVFISDDLYKFKDCLNVLFKVGLYFYFDIINLYLKRDVVYFNDYIDQLEEIMKNNLFNDIICKIDIINSFIDNSRYNVNKELFIDNFIISMGGVSDD